MRIMVLNNDQLDALKEIGSIGACNAATALSQLLNRKVLVNVPQVKFLPADKIAGLEFTADPSEISISVSLKILGDLNGDIMIMYSRKSALLMTDILMRRAIGTTQSFTPMDNSAITESSHILSSSYLNAVGETLSIHRLIPSISSMAVDKAEKVKQIFIKGLEASSDTYILPIENHMNIEGVEVDIYVIFLLNLESVLRILKTVGL